MKHYFKYLFYCSALLLFITSCKEEPKDTNLLFGKWVITKAERDQKETKTLNGAYFKFDEASNNMESNLLGEIQ
ncbi:MAG: hypothetical protein AAGK97_12120, partial [Bacteroidota bacterium]